MSALSSHRVSLAAACAVALLLTGTLGSCVLSPLDPRPASTGSGEADPDVVVEELDVAAIEQAMLEVIPVANDPFVSEARQAGLAEPTFGAYTGLMEIDHESARIARASSTFVSNGWEDPTLGPGFYIVTELVRMKDVRAADTVLTDVALGAKEPTTQPATETEPAVEFTPPAAPLRAEWPTGTVESSLRFIWPEGMRAEGIMGYMSSGPYVFVMWGAASTYPGSAEGLSAFFDAHLASTLERLATLPDA